MCDIEIGVKTMDMKYCRQFHEWNEFHIQSGALPYFPDPEHISDLHSSHDVQWRGRQC